MPNIITRSVTRNADLSSAGHKTLPDWKKPVFKRERAGKNPDSKSQTRQLTLFKQAPRNSKRDCNRLIEKLGITNMAVADYIPSPIDKTDLVTVKPVHLLGGSFGLYATRDIPKGTCIGQYTGEEFAKDQFATYLSNHPEADNNYAMDVGEGVTVDAARKGNFTRYINFSDSQDNVEFAQSSIGSKKIAKIVALTDIKAGQQLLVNYNTYDEKASKIYYFINPGDSWLSAQELHHSLKHQYSKTQLSYHISQFKLSQNDTLVATKVGLAVLNSVRLEGEYPDSESIDAPLLKINGDEVVDYARFDSFTPLMLACYLGQVENVRWLIQHGANVNQQQNHSGNSPLLLALKGCAKPCRQEKCFQIIKELLQNNANVFTHNRQDRTFFHAAAKNLSAHQLKELLTLLKKQLGQNYYKLFDYLDKHNCDPLMYCYRKRLFKKSELLLLSYPDYFVTHLLNEELEADELQANIQNFHDCLANYAHWERRLFTEQVKHPKIKVSDESLKMILDGIESNTYLYPV